MLPRIVASDLDGTLLRSDGSLSPRTARALAAVQAAGCRVVLCTARPVRWVRPIAAQAGANGCAVCVNGAVIWDFAADAAIREDAIAADVVLDVVTRLDDLFPGGAWGVEHAAGFDHEPGYRPHWPVPPETVVAPVGDLLGVSPLKLLFRHDAHSPDEMLGPARAALRGVVELSHSNSADGLLEISAPGIDKGAGLARLCAMLDVGPQEVIAFGDMPNDLALLEFAGRAVAVANAHPDVLAMADEIASGHDEDGVAIVLERLLASPRGEAHLPLRGRGGPNRSHPEIVFVTGTQMPRPDPETDGLITVLARSGVPAELHRWNGPFPFASVPLVVCRTTWDYLGDSAGFRAWIAAVGAVTALENPPALMEWNLHKSYLVELARAGVPVIETRLLRVGASAAQRSAVLAAFDEVVIKPAVSGGAAGALRALGRDPAAGAHLDGLLARGDALVQPFEPAIAAGEVSLIYFGGKFSHAVRKTPDPADWRVQVHHGGVNTLHQANDQELAAGAAALTALPAAPLYARIDLVGAGAPKVMEAELVEPELFLGLAPQAAGRYANALCARLTTAVAPARG